MRLSTQTARCSGALALPLVAAALLLAACGGGSNGTASGDSASEQAGLKFARCMREHGVNMPDPGANGEIRLMAKRGDAAKVDAAQKACGHFLRALARTASPADTQRIQDAALKYARCMRSHGVDFPDPKFHGAGVQFGGPGLNPYSPQFQQADKACHGLLPDGGKGRVTQKSGGGGGPAGFRAVGKP
jgi:hypothetical protein